MPLFLLSSGFIDDIAKYVTSFMLKKLLQFCKETFLPSAGRELNIGYLMQ